MIAKIAKNSLTVLDKFQAETMSLNLSERASTASMTLDESAPEITIGDWIQIENGIGAGIVWRVKSVETQVEKKTRTVQLEHMIATLKDLIMFGEVTASTISGSSANPTASAAVQYILSRQNIWRLGGIAYNVSNPYEFNGDTLFAALETVSGTLEECIWEYSFASYPFTLYIRQKDSTVCSEMRTDRNIRTLRKSVDKSQMYTRFYPIGKNNLHITGEYVSKNEDLYGTICKTETDQGLDSEEKLLLWANERLNRHCEPLVNVSISGLDLAEATGESLDSFVIGKMCRVPLPELGTTITERVTKLSYSDIVHRPQEVTITLANEVLDVASIIKEQQKTSGRAGRVGAKQGEADHAWFVDTTDHVGMVAEAVAGPGANKDWSRVSQIYADGEGIHQRVTYTENQIVIAEARIEVTEHGIEQEVIDRTAADDNLQDGIDVITGSGLWVQRDNITGVTGQFYKDSDGKVHIIEGSGLLMDRNSASFGLYDEGNLSGGIMVTKINGQTTLKLKAAVIDIDGVVSSMQAKDVMVANFNANDGEFAGDLNVLGDTTLLDVQADNVVVNGLYLDDGDEGTEFQVLNAEVSGNTLTITKTDGTSITFSRATSLSGSWSGGTYTVAASPQGNTISTTIFLTGTTSITSNGTYVYQAAIYDSEGEVEYIGASISADVNISTSHSPTIDDVWTSSSIPSGASELRSIKTNYENAKSDGDNFLIRVKCGGSTKTYYCTP